jgi:hypothetical protein
VKSLPEQERFDDWMGSIIDDIITDAHAPRCGSAKEEAAKPEQRPVGYIAAKIIRAVTQTTQKWEGFIRLCLSLILAVVKEEYDETTWAPDAADRVAQRTQINLSRAIGIYLLKFNSVKVLASEGQDAGEEDDDYYVGQTLASFEERLGRHEYLLGKNSAQLRAIYANKLPVLYRKGYLRNESQRQRCILADISAYENNVNTTTVLATTLESAFCIFFGTLQVNNFDSSTAVDFCARARPVDMQPVTWESFNHAFPLRQTLSINAWKERERQILIDTQMISRDGHINVNCQDALLKEGFVRTVRAVERKRGDMGLWRSRDAVVSTEDTASDNLATLQEKVAERIVGKFRDLPRGVKVDEFRVALSGAGVQKSVSACGKILHELFPDAYGRADHRWTDPQKAKAAHIKAKHDVNGKRSEMAGELVEALKFIREPRSFRSYYFYFTTRWPEESPQGWSGWSDRERDLLETVESSHPALSAKVLGPILSERLLADLKLERTPKACIRKIERTRKKRSCPAHTGGNNRSGRSLETSYLEKRSNFKSMAQ